MTTTDPAALLRRAADTITEFATGTTPGSWNGFVSSEGPGYGEVSGGPWENGYRMGSVMRWCEETVTEYGGEPSQADLSWLCLMSPHIAPALIAWLRAEAEAVGVKQRAVEDVTHPSFVGHLDRHHGHALAFARALLDEDHPAAVAAGVQRDAMPERAQ